MHGRGRSRRSSGAARQQLTELAGEPGEAACVGGLGESGPGDPYDHSDSVLRLNPQAKLVAGYQPEMPTFQGLVNEEGLMALIEYIKSLQPSGAAPQP